MGRSSHFVPYRFRPERTGFFLFSFSLSLRFSCLLVSPSALILFFTLPSSLSPLDSLCVSQRPSTSQRLLLRFLSGLNHPYLPRGYSFHGPRASTQPDPRCHQTFSPTDAFSLNIRRNSSFFSVSRHPHFNTNIRRLAHPASRRAVALSASSPQFSFPKALRSSSVQTSPSPSPDRPVPTAAQCFSMSPPGPVFAKTKTTSRSRNTPGSTPETHAPGILAYNPHRLPPFLVPPISTPLPTVVHKFHMLNGVAALSFVLSLLSPPLNPGLIAASAFVPSSALRAHSRAPCPLVISNLTPHVLPTIPHPPPPAQLSLPSHLP